MNTQNNWNMNDFIKELEKSGLENKTDYEIENALDNKLIVKLNSHNAVKEFTSNEYMDHDKYNEWKTNPNMNNRNPLNDYRNIYTKLDFNIPNNELGSVALFSSDINNNIQKGVLINSDSEKFKAYTTPDQVFNTLQADLNEINQMQLDVKENNILKPSAYEKNWNMDSYIEKLENSSLEKGTDYNIVQSRDNKLAVEIFTGAAALELSTDQSSYKYYSNRDGEEEGLKAANISIANQLNNYGERKIFLVMDFDKDYSEQTATTQMKVDGDGSLTYVIGRSGQPLGIDSEDRSLELKERIKELKDNLDHHLNAPNIDGLKTKEKLTQEAPSKQDNSSFDNDIESSMQSSLLKLQEERLKIDSSSSFNKKDISQNKTIKNNNFPS